MIRPTGLLDPLIEVKPVEGQVDDLLSEVNKEVEKGNKVLVTTLTKRMAEDLTDYLRDQGVKVKYLHSDIDRPIVCTSEVSERKNPSLSASKIATSVISGISRPSLNRLIPTNTSKMAELNFEMAAEYRDKLKELKVALRDYDS